MNKFPLWLNTLVLAILLAGCLFALPNSYGSVPAVQIAEGDGIAYEERQVAAFVRSVENAGVTPEAAYIQDGRIVLRFHDENEQVRASDHLRLTYDGQANVASTLAPKLPSWVRDLGLKPMSLGLDLRGGVYVLLEVDMETAIDSRMKGYSQSFDERLRDAKISRRVEVDGQRITIRLRDAADLEPARDVIRRTDQDVLIADGAAGHPPMIHVRVVAVPHRDCAVPARQRIVAPIVILKLVGILQVKGDGTVFAVDLKGVVVLAPTGISC